MSSAPEETILRTLNILDLYMHQSNWSGICQATLGKPFVVLWGTTCYVHFIEHTVSLIGVQNVIWRSILGCTRQKRSVLCEFFMVDHQNKG